jgi:Ice-binding-like/Bacterial Ig-like domain
MRKYRIGITSFLASLLVVFIAGCGQETVTVPSVVSTIPANGAADVVIGTTVSATFSMAMNPSSVTASTVTLVGPGGTAVTGAVTYNGLTATFTPSAPLAYSSVYTATITTGVTNIGGTPLLANYVWSFTTIAPAPAVIATIPANGAVSVPITQVLSATFSEAMSPATIIASTFTVTGPGGTSVAGAVAYSGVTATFTPATSLAYGAVYTATIATGATNLAGTPLPSNYVWSFTTITPAPLVVSTVPLNGATGVPLAQVLTATFNEAMNCSTLASTTLAVTGPGATAVAGTVGCAGAIATFTPAGVLAVNTVYTATISTGVQDLAGTPLAANYRWTFRTVPAPAPPAVISTVPISDATGVPINQALSATFSVAMNPGTVDDTTFTLTATGGTAVTGIVSYVAAGSIATLTPAANLAPSTQYTATITTGAMDLEGTSLAQNYVWTFTTAATVIVTPPTVIATIPLNAATSVPLNQIVSATFSKAMNPATINGTTFTLAGPGATPVAGLLAYAAVGDTLTFTPTANLSANTLFTATITTGAQDLAGDALASNYVWTFTTGAAAAAIPPEIVSTIPANAAANVALNQAVSATFTDAMNPLTISTATFQLTGPGGTAVAGTVSYDAINFIATFTPTLPLVAATTYTATVTNGATDLAGNPLGTTGAPNPWTFTTGAAIVPPPVVLGPTILLFGGFGGNAGMTNQGIHTVVNGDIGTTGASTLMTGFYDESIPPVAGVYPCSYTVTTLNMGLVNGAIDTAAPPPTGACPNEGTATTMAIATEAALEAQTAYTTLQNLPPGTVLPTNELGNLTLAPGTYTSASFYDITAGPLTLDAQGDPNASWVFQMGTYLTVGTPSASESIVLANGAQAGNVFWQVGSAATINYGGGGTMVGTIISQAGITVSSPGQSTASTVTTVNGRLLALGASVTIVNTVINAPQ